MDIVMGYINRMLMAEDIDDKFEHYLEHPAVVAALLTTSSLSSVARVCLVFHIFKRYIASVVYRCCKSRSGCCTVAMAIHVCF